MKLNNWRDEIVTSDIFYFDYNTAPEQTVASYTVKHFKQSVNKSYSTTPDETETFTGIVGDIVSPNVKSYY